MRGSVNRSVPRIVKVAPGASVPAGTVHSSGALIKRSLVLHPREASAAGALSPVHASLMPISSRCCFRRCGAGHSFSSPTGSPSSLSPGGAAEVAERAEEGTRLGRPITGTFAVTPPPLPPLLSPPLGPRELETLEYASAATCDPAPATSGRHIMDPPRGIDAARLTVAA